MQATTSTAIWTAGPLSNEGGRALRFGKPRGRGIEWFMHRNCSLAPRQLLAVYLSFCVVALAVAGFMWAQGAVLVLPFAWLELIALGVALLAYARHATDAERIELQEGRLVVEHRCAQQTQRTEFDAAWLRVEPEHADGSLIELSGDGRRVAVGRYMRPELREALARELRGAVQSWRQRGA